MNNLSNLYKSLTISERYRILENMSMKENDYTLNLWRSEMSIISNSTFEKMLETKGYFKEIFSNAVNGSPEDEVIKKYKLKAMESEWYQFFQDSLSAFSENIHQNPKDIQYAISPFILQAKKVLINFLNINSLNTIVTEDALDNLISQLTQSLVDLAHKPLVLELNIQREEGNLHGNTSEERFYAFLQGFSQIDNMMSFYNKYIVLTRLLATSTIYFLNNIQKLLVRFRDDENAIINNFNVESYVIQDIKLGEGDTHQGGNTVSIVTFMDGTKIVYKPKKLDINIAFSKLIKWLNSHDNIEKLKTVKTLPYKEYTYEEYIEYKPCRNLDEVSSYYIQFGQLMGIIQLLNGTDIHMENLISNGKHPVIIDLETLIQMPTPLQENQGKTMDKIANTIFHHVTRTLFLPTNGVKVEDPLNVDLSALNGRKQKLPVKVLQPVNIGTDEMKYDFKDYHLEGSNNLPFIEGKDMSINYTVYKDSIIQGFRNVCLVFLNNKKELLRKDGILEGFNGILVRCLFRDTNQYASILMHMQHPELLMDMLDREKAIENMWAYPFPDKKLILSEAEDMLVNDIPIFFNRTSDPSIIDSNNVKIEKFYNEKPYDYLVSCIKKLDINEVNKQVSIIKLHFGEFSEYKKKHNKELYTEQASISYLPKLELNLLKEARGIADYVMERAYKEDKVSWIIPYNSAKDTWSLIPIKEDLYNGTSGLYLLFYYLYQETGEEKYNQFSNKLLDECYVGILNNKQFGLSGFPGFFYAFSLIEDYGNNKLKINKLINEYCKLFEDILEEGIDENLEIDYVNGITGLINALLRFYKKRKDEKFIRLAINFTNELEKRIENISLETGYAHGTLGYALTFFRIGEMTSVKRYMDRAKKLLASENYNFRKIYENISWCNGIIGEGMARLELAKSINDNHNNTILKDIMKRVSDSPLLINDCICHGNMGTTEFLLNHYLKSGDENSNILANKIADSVIMSKTKNGQYKLMDIREYPDVSLFTGLGGIAYQLLRLNNPENVPSVLTI